MNIKQLKKELQLSNTKIAVIFDLTPMAFANSTAKKRYEQALCRFYEYVKKHEAKQLLIPRVVGQSKQLCDCKKHSIKTNYGFEICTNCGNEWND